MAFPVSSRQRSYSSEGFLDGQAHGILLPRCAGRVPDVADSNELRSKLQSGEKNALLLLCYSCALAILTCLPFNIC